MIVAVPLVPPKQETGVVAGVPLRIALGEPTTILLIFLVHEFASVMVTL